MQASRVCMTNYLLHWPSSHPEGLRILCDTSSCSPNRSSYDRKVYKRGSDCEAAMIDCHRLLPSSSSSPSSLSDMFCRRLLVLLVLVAGLLAATADAQPSRRDHSRRVSDCSNKLNRFGLRPARLFCVAYLNGRQPTTPSTTLTTTQTTTLAAATTTVPATVTSTETTTVSETTTTTLSTSTATTTTETITTTPTSTDSVTATETTTTTVTDVDAQRRRRSVLPTALNPVPPYHDGSPLEKRGALTSSQAASIFGSFVSSEITEACLLIVYGRTSNPTQKVTATVTATSTPAPLTTSSTTTQAVTDTKTDTSTETVTTTTATLTVTSTSVEQAPTVTVTTTVATDTVTSTTTVAPAPTVTSGVLKAVLDDGTIQYASTSTDFGSASRKLSLVSGADSASRVTLDLTASRLLLASDTTFKSSTVGSSSVYYFRMTQDGAYSPQNIITCSLASGTNQLSCTTSEGYTVLQSCGGQLSIGSINGCGTGVTLYLQ
ncbi:hypothetical protein PHSY_000301 [Pseudozyma hubeiensis SY62]|uniref:Uncharacterized protein n=1 Tax=Pseudozyma hubeiensis (strain SY62) TaxID=1305764 RepID=R9NW92_PSEHS|nr:hypothetical protein PHSY_000301 [Pseudozyma hubeiensis SY62]GAC92746.1 hypothetical protein PHSY_000301 [Pseudozyma hubeiensis SY62]